MYEELVKKLRSHNGWALNKTLDEAADAIEELSKPMIIRIDHQLSEEEIERLCKEIAKTPIVLIPAEGEELSKPRWIPVTERLPEPYSGEYLVAINDGSIYVDVLWFDSPGDGRYDSCFYKLDNDGYAIICTDAIAWMPLPEPPKEEKP